MTTNAPQPGRPNIYGARMATYTVTLDKASAALLKALGNGNLSAGTRKAARLYINHQPVYCSTHTEATRYKEAAK